LQVVFHRQYYKEVIVLAIIALKNNNYKVEHMNNDATRKFERGVSSRDEQDTFPPFLEESPLRSATGLEYSHTMRILK